MTVLIVYLLLAEHDKATAVSENLTKSFDGLKLPTPENLIQNKTHFSNTVQTNKFKLKSSKPKDNNAKLQCFLGKKSNLQL